MQIKRGTIEDIPQILPLWRKLSDTHCEMEPMFKLVENAEEKFAAYLSLIFTKENFAIFVAESDSKIIGYLIANVSTTPEVYVIRRRLYIQDMMVSPDYRRQGIAGKLVNVVVAFAKEQQIEKMDLLVAVKNEEANKFWKAMGFEPALNYMTQYLV
jgi:ribosomal protein S18 acetylase RimI-like enzyme